MLVQTTKGPGNDDNEVFTNQKQWPPTKIQYQ